MKRNLKRIFSVVLILVMAFTALPLAVFAIEAEATAYKTGDIIEFGSYPQSKVADSETLSALNSLDLNWISYGYLSGDDHVGSMTSSDYMKYADVIFNGINYRAVQFTQYRPSYSYNKSSSSYSEQDDNGYTTNTVYWFKYETLEWRVLDPVDGLLMCETIIDSQPYNSTVYHNINTCYGNLSYTNYANDYATSSIRE